MKYKLIIFTGFIGLIFLISNCQKTYNELEEDSFYYVYNGQEFDQVKCYFHSGIQKGLVYLNYNNQDTLHLTFCVQTGRELGRDQLHFNINNYHGQGKYYFDSASGNTSTFTFDYTDLPAESNTKTYLYVLEVDTKKRIIRALFEGNYLDQYNVLHQFDKGRMDVHFVNENN